MSQANVSVCVVCAAMCKCVAGACVCVPSVLVASLWYNMSFVASCNLRSRRKTSEASEARRKRTLLLNHHLTLVLYSLLQGVVLLPA